MHVGSSLNWGPFLGPPKSTESYTTLLHQDPKRDQNLERYPCDGAVCCGEAALLKAESREGPAGRARLLQSKNTAEQDFGMFRF